MNQTLIRRLNPARAVRGPLGDDEGIALLIVIMAVMIITSLSVLALGAIVVQAKPTQFQRKNTQTISASEAGLDAALTTIRNATYIEGTTVYGDRSQLPCWTSHVGQLGDPGGAGLTYTVTITYFKIDPAKQTAAWRALNKMPCTTGIGTATTPTHAFITSDGSGAALPQESAAKGNRTLQSIYTFSSTNPNLPGGLIKDSQGLCYAGGAVAGGAVTMANCLTGSDLQMWAYSTDYQIVLTSTRNSDGSGGMCLTADPGSGPSPAVNANMQPCSLPVAVDYTQKWGVSNSDPVAIFGHLTGSFTGTQWCLGAVSPGVPGGLLSAGPSCTGVYPQAQVGAGAAGTTVPTVAELDNVPLQWVNYQEFGRCLDVTGWNLNTQSQIIYPCKQDPMADALSAAKPGWNEVFTWSSATKRFWVNGDPGHSHAYDGSKDPYCMRSPNTNGGYVTYANLCPDITAATPIEETWTVNRDDPDLVKSYTIVDAFGRCLAAGPKNPSNAAAYSSVITVTCDGGLGQKWNAPPNLASASLGDIAEVPNH